MLFNKQTTAAEVPLNKALKPPDCTEAAAHSGHQ